MFLVGLTSPHPFRVNMRYRSLDWDFYIVLQHTISLLLVSTTFHTKRQKNKRHEANTNNELQLETSGRQKEKTKTMIIPFSPKLSSEDVDCRLSWLVTS